jgi:hypothetical protein
MSKQDTPPEINKPQARISGVEMARISGVEISMC